LALDALTSLTAKSCATDERIREKRSAIAVEGLSWQEEYSEKTMSRRADT
jgi:hypothetical protein